MGSQQLPPFGLVQVVTRWQFAPVVTGFAVLAAGYAGSLCGITTSYVVGRQGLLYVIERMPFFRRHSGKYMERVRIWFERYGRSSN